jgi:hypothetical protein
MVRLQLAVAALAAALAVVAASTPARADALHPAASTAQTAGRWREASLDEYRRHLLALSALVKACAKGRDMKTCDPTLVGPDDRVPLGGGANAERRLVRYGWLRILFFRALDKDPAETAPKPAAGAKGAPAAEPTLPPPRTTTELLQDAEARLDRELAQAGGTAAATLPYTQERDTMKQVLAGKDFRNLEGPSVRDTVLEEFGNWLNRLLESAARLGSRSPWIGRLIVWAFVMAVCVGLVWGLLQLERRWRFRLVPEDGTYAPGAASARRWQLWLEDARAAEAAGRWREAVHSVYWAAISRLEARRLWPADRARTPREYLALVAAEDPRRAGLAALTGSFERIWYGGRAAGERDYRKAEQLTAALIAGGGASPVGADGTASQGVAEGPGQ